MFTMQPLVMTAAGIYQTEEKKCHETVRVWTQQNRNTTQSCILNLYPKSTWRQQAISLEKSAW